MAGPEAFIAELRLSIDRWKSERGTLASLGATGFLPVVQSWIDEGEQLMAAHEARRREERAELAIDH
jgi:hypothetical protein